ncbi:M23 family metallopeptidase [Marilutibacter chinensis]|uniref:M23 family metallopeptidase n=1 Tax=Marilutibacter chinensis TaxID=2912247 RepID=A0ABS9HQ34_9GAMM|nr:M23 family metallopeptidase [Lysobacter chinensis]MCF7220723.1 M23 family metallopeptidase [Lysobacter chinensis]
MKLRTTLLAGSILIAAMSSAHAAGPRPLFQFPAECGQIWDASTYSNHWPDPDSIDITVRGNNLANIGAGEPVLASAAGTVTFAGMVGDEYRVYLDHGNGWVTHYIHLETETPLPIVVGRQVAQGEQIGRTGKSGAQAIHQHYTQLRDNDAVRIAFAGALINTHAGNPSSYGTWGTNSAEKIISLNCAGNTFMGWTQTGYQYELLYKPGSGQTKIVRVNAGGAGVTTTWEGSWSTGWTNFMPYHLAANGHPHAIVYKSSTGEVRFLRMNLHGAGVTNLTSGTWYKGWTDFVPLTLDGDKYFIAYDSVHGYANIDRIRASGDGSSNVYRRTWEAGRTALIPYKLGNAQYLLMYKGGTGEVEIDRITGSGTNIAVDEVWSGTWTKGWTNLVPVSHQGQQFLLGYKAASGEAKLIKLKSGGQGVEVTSAMSWTTGWTAFSPMLINGRGHVLLYKLGTGQAKMIRFRDDASGVDVVWQGNWTTGWK